MDFISKSFPDNHVHISLFQLKGKDESITTQQMDQRKAGLALLARQHQQNFTIINARLIASLMHLNLAVSRALLNKRDNIMKTKPPCLGNEIVYYVTPQHSFQLEKFGIKNCNEAFFAVFVDYAQEVGMMEREIEKHTNKKLPDLNQHLEYQDV